MGVARRFASGQWCEAPSKPPLRAIELQSLAGGSSINARYATSIRPPPEVWLMVSTTVALTCARLQCGSGGHMSKSRRQFLARTSLGLLGAAAAGPGSAEARRTSAWPAARRQRRFPPGAPPALGAAPAVGPEVSPSTFAEAEKLMQVELTGTERAVAAGSWRTTMAPLYERRTGPRKVGLPGGPWRRARRDAALPGRPVPRAAPNDLRPAPPLRSPTSPGTPAGLPTPVRAARAILPSAQRPARSEEH